MHQLTHVKDFLETITVYRLVTDQVAREVFLTYFSFAFDITPPCTGCPGELEVAIGKLKWLVKKHSDDQPTLKKAMELSKYTMKPGKRVYSFKLGMMVTTLNCTDEMAELLMAENEAHKALFTFHVEADQAAPVVSTPPPAAKKVIIGKKEEATPTQPVLEQPKAAQAPKKEVAKPTTTTKKARKRVKK
jgi:hypothetical protein